MKIFNYATVEAEKAEGCPSDVKVRWLITKETGAENFAMRLFELEPCATTPLHTHPWEHEVFILEGEGVVFDGKNTTPFKADDTVFVPPDEWHQFRNTGAKSLRFLCLVPYNKSQSR